ncbi:MAG: hypothetical protein A2Z91_01400 [Deltaproteobacteria bacterium GWA2_38_16]|nr:MAG: hypothetical protein A2Z91_01400 [Deltaproteobacteria bacterium GWA2_38_16]OGQ02201.1 MAG: hypothetical protein A3D19_05475 [Deltaproteobacteria bacterium RIFCSPHIGHO2_02_FULL_38_15]OGQ33732.1 MAG: hypothetical protein A3A72_06280 [Deltaproteobacteria bacterium RIFCSPLOWO2_01_FULL_38_9]OGQ60627.1 MAG: hypothetical protein A3G92_05485 [Deltaproteobacteria bacterium RIFCSPLOWO2_12_FULL_38_8]HBQ21997.1 NADH-quinone oxidoreductase subunit C [Deltaproteobacteria bacterium]
MLTPTIHEKLTQKFENAILPLKELPPGSHSDPFIAVNSSKLHSVLKYLKEDSDLLFDNLICISGVDYPDRIEVVYHLFSYKHLHKVVIKSLLSDKTKPVLESTCDLWKAANWLEREVFDIMGVHFNNHPDLRRILLPEDWEGHPLRKDYKTQEFWHGIKVGM